MAKSYQEDEMLDTTVPCAVQMSNLRVMCVCACVCVCVYVCVHLAGQDDT